MDTAQEREISRDQKNWYRLSSRILDKDYQRRGRLPKRERQALQDRGMYGAYKAYLNKTLPRQPPEGTRKTLPTNWWKVLLQLSRTGVAERKPLVFVEALTFAWTGRFVHAWCDHRHHWYIADDPRRKDCCEQEHIGPKVRLIAAQPQAAKRGRWREL